MATSCLYDNDTDRRLHSSAIRMLAREFNVPEEEIQALYETMLSSLKESARIKDYLAVLVSRNVKDMIRRGVSSQTS
ncbi:MAG TPA: DUF3562 domain-containing protein [Thermodesulfovibrionales bacterium]|nr:DUF3562 domain-containing protein [Thermodesulfovibrionales bacterium]